MTLVAHGRPQHLPYAADLVVGPMARRAVLAQADVVVTSDGLHLRELTRLRAAVVSDLYDPSFFEWLSLDQEERLSRVQWVARQLGAVRRALRISGAVMCANERQRDLLLGALLPTFDRATLGQLDEAMVARRVLVVPNGVSGQEELPPRDAARERLGFSDDEVVLLWGGGVWNWLDVETVVRAAERAAEVEPRIRLVFLGVKRSGTLDPFASKAGPLLERYVTGDGHPSIVVNENWVTPERRLDYLAAADAGVLGQFDTLETHFSFRTRMIDCLQAGIPLVGMGGDELSDRAAREGWGMISAIGDVDAMADNMVRFARDAPTSESLRSATAEAASTMSWEYTLCVPRRRGAPPAPPDDRRAARPKPSARARPPPIGHRAAAVPPEKERLRCLGSS